MEDSGTKSKKEIDLVGIVLLLWSKRKQIIINCFIGGILSIIVAFSIPKEYTSNVVMAPEMSSGSSAPGGLGALASMAGINLNMSSMGNDAFYPELYPQIVSSTPFLSEILLTQVKSGDGEVETTLYEYLLFHQKSAWWTKIISYPIELIKGDDKVVELEGLGEQENHSLSKQQYKILTALDKLINISVDKGNNVITVGVTLQDPDISATVAGTVADKLQEYVEKYRSAKARKDLEYTEKLCRDSEVKYREAQQAYANFANQHQNITNARFQIELDRLSNEKDLAFGVYSQLAQNLEISRARVQEQTPVCVVMQPAVVPIKASSPKKMMIGLLYVFIAIFGTVACYIIKDRIIDTANTTH